MDRRALVIGNSSYPGSQLPTAVNDAFDMAKALRDLDFEVDLRLEQTHQQMEDAVRDLRDRLTAGSVGLFYFAGRGAQIQQSNYLIPLSEKGLAPGEIKHKAMALSFVLEELANAESWLDIIIIDASREHPIGLRNLAKGLAAEQSPAVGTLIAYATAPGSVAIDGTGRNSVFTAALLAALEKPDLQIEEILKITREAVVESTDGLQVPWVSTSAIGQFIPRQTPSETSTDVCLNLLKSAEQPNLSGSLRLGRVLWAGEAMEPVLIRKNDEGERARYSFRDCSSGVPTEVAIDAADLEIFNSALVARFAQEKSGALTTYRQVPYLGYERRGEAKLAFRGAGSMLEARRLDDAHVEITGTGSVQISHLERIAIVLVTTRETMKSMEPKIWDESWGDQSEDSKILREIIWWELTSPGHLRVHPPVERFGDLASLVAGSTGGPETDWTSILEGSLKSLLDRNFLSLLIAEQSDHIDLAERMLKLANETNNDAELDVGSLGEKWRESTRWRLEEAASRGRYWPFTSPFDLAAIMPDRIAGKIRRNYHQRLSSSDIVAVDTGFAKDYLVLAADSPALQIANAIFQDQVARMAKTMDFMGCLLDNDSVPNRFEILEKGLNRLKISSERLEEMDADKAFRHLFQGFSLPADLPVKRRSFLRILNSGNPEVLPLVRSLQGYLNAAAVESDGACKVVLIPDAVLAGEPVESLVVPSIPEISLSIPADSEVSEAGSSTDNYHEAMQAKAEARIALKRAIYANGLRHKNTRRYIRRGHERLKRGNIILETKGEGLAVREFRRARALFLKAEEKAFRIEHSLPKLRVH